MGSLGAVAGEGVDVAQEIPAFSEVSQVQLVVRVLWNSAVFLGDP